MWDKIGTFLLGLALAAALYGAAAAWWSIRRQDERLGRSAQRAGYAMAGLLGGALWLLLLALLGNRFELRYVARHTATYLPFYLKVPALWAGQEGSLLLWSFVQALFAALATRPAAPKTRPLIPWATIFLNLITAFFIALTLFHANPFVTRALPPAEGQGLNPILRHLGMICHPPALYVGFVGLSVPYAFALAALITGKIEEWTVALRPWLPIAWLSLGLGLLLGMRWAYDVLGWGGYWGWDPVENAGLLPWLTATALLHGIVLQKEGHSFHAWNLALAIVSFVLVLFGTFATRSGLIQSVHAYTRSNLGLYLALALAFTLAAPLLLLIRRPTAPPPTGAPDPPPPLSRPGLLLLTLILFSTLTASVLVGTLLPTLTGGRFETGAAWFDRVTGPQLAALMLLLGVYPLIGRATAPLRGQRHKYGSVLTHGGVILMALGVIGTRMYAFEQALTLSLDAPTRVGPYTLIYQGLQNETAADCATTQATVVVYQNPVHRASLTPHVDQYAAGRTLSIPAIRHSLHEDLYLTLLGWDADGATAAFQVFINPLVNGLWLGGLLLLVGGAVALWSSRVDQNG